MFVMDVTLANAKIGSTRLSTRQRQCLRLVDKGLTSKEIGRTLNLSPSTVDNHIQTACDRLGSKNRIDAARMVRIGDTLEPDESGLSDYVISQKQTDSKRKRGWQNHLRQLLKFPPLGGTMNVMPRRRRVMHLFQIMIVGIIVATAAILSITGVVHILSMGK